MAQYDIAHSCGHTETHQIYGSNTRGEREARARRLSEGTCSDCYRAARRGQLLELSGWHANLDALPPLAGSGHSRVADLLGVPREPVTAPPPSSAPLPVYPADIVLAAQAADTACRHGMPYDETCAACDASFK